MNSRIQDVDTAVAVHESGHAIVARALGIDVMSTSAIGALTRTRWRGGTAALAIPMIDLAGPAAEHAYLRRTVWRADLENARRRVLQIVALRHGVEDADELVARLAAQAAALIEQNWSKIEIVAAALSEDQTLSGADIDALLKCALEKTALRP